MKKEIIDIDKEKGIFRVTTNDERWYMKPDEDAKTRLPTYKFYPSVTWITEHYPKGIAFYKWLAGKGWDEAESLKNQAGDKGSKVHKAIEMLLEGQTIKMDEKIQSRANGEVSELTVEEYNAVMSFMDWYKTYEKIVLLKSEFYVFNEKDNYAGTVDLHLEIDGEPWIIDIKTSANVYPNYELQVSAYKHAMNLEKEPKLAILQVGYSRNKAGYKFTEIEDQYDIFLATQQIWAKECKGQKPYQKDYPVKLSLKVEKKEEEVLGSINEYIKDNESKTEETESA